jgi:tetratricopeptide (TPR) repeat protein
MQMALESLKPDKKSRGEIHDRLASEVDAILDRSAGPNRYTRDDSLQENILQHYRISLERMVELARTANARIMFVTPASNLKDCSPFKSEHTPGLDQATRQLTEQMLLQGKNAIHLANWNEALALLKKAVSLDPRHAEMQYRLGRTLLALNRYAEAEAALRLARDEDVCPLRALTPMRDIMIDIAKQQHVGLVDYVDLLEVGTQGEYGHPIAGEEFFLDHVHPTIEGHKILALGVIQAMADQGLVKLEADWGMKTIAAVSERIEKKIDRNVNGQALAKLSRVLLWAGKNEDATRLARQALDIAGDNKQVFIAANGTLVSAYQRQDDQEKALKSLYKAIEYAPDSTELHLRLGQALMNPPFLKLEEAAANLLFVCQKMPYYYAAHQLFGLVMAKRGRPRVAHASLTEALRLNPNNTTTQSILSRIRPQLGKSPQDRKIPAILLETHPSLAPRKLMQVRRDQESGRNVIDGIAVEFYENGRVKSLTDFDQGAPVGHEIKWDNSGRILSNGKHPLRKVVNTKSVD